MLLGLLLLAACGNLAQPSGGEASLPITPKSPSLVEAGEDSISSATPSVNNVRIQDDNEYNFPFLIPFDGIPPVYDPEFVAADEAPLIEEELVIGVAWGGESKAYPISVLRFREMVNDELAGIPTLVTW
jgi:hypothetical protein